MECPTCGQPPSLSAWLQWSKQRDVQGLGRSAAGQARALQIYQQSKHHWESDKLD